MIDPKRSFTFDDVFEPQANQEEVYRELAAPLVSQFFDGYNATILAYGQTFSGKTYTMGSNNYLDTPDDEAGIIPRVVRDLYSKIEADENWNYITKVSFLEVYQEQVRDLLAEDMNAPREINIRDIKGQIVVSGIQEDVASGIGDMMDYLAKGAQDRSTVL